MKTLIPQLFLSMKQYTKEQFTKDVVSGIIVAIIALPLSIALALASGVTPEQGLYTAIIAGFVISFLGGSKVQIAGPTAAFATIVAGIVIKNGMEGLATATVLAGLILVIMGFLRLGSLIRFIPYTITTGFTTGIAVTIFIGQIKDFLGLTFMEAPVETMEKLGQVISCINTLNLQALAVGAVSLAILILWPGFFKKVPPSLIAVVAAAVLVKALDLKVNTIGDLYTISSGLPAFRLPSISFSMVQRVMPDAITIAVLAAIESLLSCVVADGMIGGKHNSNMELVAQGVGNAASALFGGIPATGAIARTAANIKNGGRSPVAGMVHAAVLLLILVFLMPYAALIPMPAIAAILFMVAYNMSEWRSFADVVRTAPKSDTAVLVLTFFLTVVFDLVMAIGVGLALACLLFMKRMADVSDIYGWKYAEDYEESTDGERIDLKPVPRQVMVFEVNGPMFFGAADKIGQIPLDSDKKVLILRMRSVPAMDATALNSLKKLNARCRKARITMILSRVNEQPLSVMEKAGFDKEIGRENIAPRIDDAICRAGEILSGANPVD
ncbi:SulP family inorganic anion transporter [Enterocloster clostridioformis]|uniref:SulP family inorganic anion transporter n=1 Tax=Enterocloster clostridioformis TaxID=1531 RepID=UPI0018AB512C|nr:SulP family inorganic anion transporter [Enterocloster clostridioformis]MDB2128673.1 SulP family inorganic anion transporter [Enterocloster clostridioformis]MDU1960842.1 SulP family inorganic anion transporter [Enterocloster clostridioformis]